MNEIKSINTKKKVAFTTSIIIMLVVIVGSISYIERNIHEKYSQYTLQPNQTLIVPLQKTDAKIKFNSESDAVKGYIANSLDTRQAGSMGIEKEWLLKQDSNVEEQYYLSSGSKITVCLSVLSAHIFPVYSLSYTIFKINPSTWGKGSDLIEIVSHKENFLRPHPDWEFVEVNEWYIKKIYSIKESAMYKLQMNADIFPDQTGNLYSVNLTINGIKNHQIDPNSSALSINIGLDYSLSQQDRANCFLFINEGSSPASFQLKISQNLWFPFFGLFFGIIGISLTFVYIYQKSIQKKFSSFKLQLINLDVLIFRSESQNEIVETLIKFNLIKKESQDLIDSIVIPKVVKPNPEFLMKMAGTKSKLQESLERYLGNILEDESKPDLNKTVEVLDILAHYNGQLTIIKKIQSQIQNYFTSIILDLDMSIDIKSAIFQQMERRYSKLFNRLKYSIADEQNMMCIAPNLLKSLTELGSQFSHVHIAELSEESKIPVDTLKKYLNLMINREIIDVRYDHAHSRIYFNSKSTEQIDHLLNSLDTQFNDWDQNIEKIIPDKKQYK